LHRGALVLKFPMPVHVDEISFTTANDLPECDPVRWTLDASRNGSAWVFLHSQASDFPMPAERLTSSLWLRLASANEEGLKRQPQETSFQAFRFTPKRLRSDVSDVVQVSEIKFRTITGSIIPMDDATVSNPGGLCDQGNGPKRIVDGTRQTCWADRNKMSILVQFPQYMRIEEFCFATAQDRPECDPVHWILEGARVGGAWTLLVSSTDEYSVPTRRSSSTVWFSMVPSTREPIRSRFGGECPHIWVGRQDFEQRLQGASFTSWEDFCSAAGPVGSKFSTPDRLHALLWLGAFLANLVIWCLLAAFGLRGQPIASLAATVAYCAVLYLAAAGGWLPLAGQALPPGGWAG